MGGKVDRFLVLDDGSEALNDRFDARTGEQAMELIRDHAEDHGAADDSDATYFLANVKDLIEVEVSTKIVVEEVSKTVATVHVP